MEKRSFTAVATKAGQKKPTAKATKARGRAKAGARAPKAADSEWRFGTLPRIKEFDLLEKGFKAVAGVDEAGRGPLAGPVVAAACIIPKDVTIQGIHDSKKLNEAQREKLFELLTTNDKISYATCIVHEKEIDEINILQATMVAMRRAVEGLKTEADYVLIDGNRSPEFTNSELSGECVIKGDSKCYLIAAASIIAKVTRDRLMVKYDAKYPEYGLKKHKGYGTREHMNAIFAHGPSPIHRWTFAPMKHMDRSKYDPDYVSEGETGAPAEKTTVVKKTTKKAAKKATKAKAKAKATKAKTKVTTGRGRKRKAAVEQDKENQPKSGKRRSSRRQ